MPNRTGIRVLRGVIVAAAAVVAPVSQRLPAQDAPVRLERVGQWGCMECTTGHQFGEIAALAVTANGTMYVVDRDEPRVRVFDAEGRLLLGTGRRGQGPGELEAPFAIGVQPDGSFSVVDIRTARITHYAADGSVVRTLPVRSNLPTAAALNPVSGQLHVATVDFRAGTGRVDRWDGGAEESRVVIATTDRFPPSEGISGTVDAMAVSPRGTIAIGDGRTEYRIRRFGPDGQVIAPDIVRAIEKTKRTPEELEAATERIARAGSRMRAALEQQTGRSSSSSPPMPAADPLRNHFNSSALQYDDAGRLWVRTERGGPGRTVFDLFDPEGRFLGEAELPAAVRDFDIAGDHLVVATRGDDDIPAVALWRIVAR